MGMYDDLTCHAVLPVCDAPTHGYQTKSLGCAGDHFVITTLDCLCYWSPLAQRVIPLHAFSGTITFYQPWHDNTGWVEFSAAFRAGIMTAVYVDHLTKE